MKAEILNAQTGTVKVTPPVKKVAIIGTSPTRNDAPYDDESWEIWGLNEMPQKRAERWFEMHPLGVQNEYELDWLKKCKEPVYLIKCYENVPMGVRYPFEKVIEGARDYFTSTFAYQMALAIYEGFEEIGLWGVNLPLGSPRERVIERTCLEWWIGFAEGKGIKIHIPEEDSMVYHPYRYGEDYFEEVVWVKKQMTNLGLQIVLRNMDLAKKIVSCSIPHNYIFSEDNV